MTVQGCANRYVVHKPVCFTSLGLRALLQVLPAECAAKEILICQLKECDIANVDRRHLVGKPRPRTEGERVMNSVIAHARRIGARAA